MCLWSSKMTTVMNSTEARENFGSLINKAQREPVQIERHGKPVAVVLSIEDFNLLSEAVAEKGEAYQKAFSEATGSVFTESDNVLKRLADR